MTPEVTTFQDIEEARSFAEMNFRRAVLFFQGQLYGTSPHYMVAEWPILTSMDSIWPKPNDVNGEWQFLEYLEISCDKDAFPEPTPRSARLCCNYPRARQIIRSFFGCEDTEISTLHEVELLEIANMILECEYH